MRLFPALQTSSIVLKLTALPKRVSSITQTLHKSRICEDFLGRFGNYKQSYVKKHGSTYRTLRCYEQYSRCKWLAYCEVVTAIFVVFN